MVMVADAAGRVIVTTVVDVDGHTALHHSAFGHGPLKFETDVDGVVREEARPSTEAHELVARFLVDEGGADVRAMNTFGNTPVCASWCLCDDFGFWF